MARIRTVKPEFFDDDVLAQMSMTARLLFVGLWTQADREGRVRDEPKRLRARLLPYDEVDADRLLDELVAGGFIVRYRSEGRPVLQVVNFLRHQIPGRDEPPSEFCSPDGSADKDIGRNPNGTVRSRIYSRDGFQCAYCRRDMTTDARARCVDHVIPLASGGTHFDFNLVTSCKPCNAKKGARNPDEAGMPWPDVTPREIPQRPPRRRGHPVNGVLTTVYTPLTLKGQERKGNRDREREKGKVDEESFAASAKPLSPEQAQAFVDEWNQLTKPPIARCTVLTAKRRRHVQSRLFEHPLAQWATVFARIQASSFCRGSNERRWRASFDWVIGSPDVAVKVLEGKYDDRVPPLFVGVAEPEYVEWVCPHTPHCPHRAACAVVAARRPRNLEEDQDGRHRAKESAEGKTARSDA